MDNAAVLNPRRGLGGYECSWETRYTPLHPLSAEDDQAYIIENAEADILIVVAGRDLCGTW